MSFLFSNHGQIHIRSQTHWKEKTELTNTVFDPLGNRFLLADINKTVVRGINMFATLYSSMMLWMICNIFQYQIHGMSTEIFTDIEYPCNYTHCQQTTSNCSYGYVKHQDCNICECYDPCFSIYQKKPCKPREQCRVVSDNNGTYETRCEKIVVELDYNQSNITSEVCQLPALTGPCRAAFPRYFYNTQTKECERFTYGGCNSNGNNFENKESCEEFCKSA